MLSFVHSSMLLLAFTLLSTKLPHGCASQAICLNNGTMILEENIPVCICAPLFTGRQCEDFACVNGLSTGGQYDPTSPFFNKRCLCDAGWTGELCDKSLVNRCGPRGEEIKGKCVCQNNFVGERCQYVTQCLHGQLYNGRCSCNYGWAGDFCDNIICHQGEPDESNKKCICPPKYRGNYCDFCSQPSSSPPPECLELGGGKRTIQIDSDNVPIVLIVLGAVFYLLCYKIKKTKEAFKKVRQTTSDIENSTAENMCETRPLHGSSNINKLKLNEDSEKFFDTPPPSYEAVALERKETKAAPEQNDSSFNSASSSAESYVPVNNMEAPNSNVLSSEQTKNQDILPTIKQKVSFPAKINKTKEDNTGVNDDDDGQSSDTKEEKLNDDGKVNEIERFENSSKESICTLIAAGAHLITNGNNESKYENVKEKIEKCTSPNRTPKLTDKNESQQKHVSHENNISVDAQLNGISKKPGLIAHGNLKRPKDELNLNTNEVVRKKNAIDAVDAIEHGEEMQCDKDSHSENGSQAVLFQ